jgi:hypothetical protein
VTQATRKILGDYLMKSLKLSFFYGFLLWLIPFIVGFVIYPLRGPNRALFETIMPLTLTIGVVFFSILYFRKKDREFLIAGIQLGVIALILSILIDLLLFMWGPMKMSFAAYMMDIGLTYLIYPIVTIGFGYLLSKRRI